MRCVIDLPQAEPDFCLRELAVARPIVRGHGGDILLENWPEGGLRVIVSPPNEREPKP